MVFDGGISPAGCIIIFAFSFLLFAVIVVRCICLRRMHSLPEPSGNHATLLSMMGISESSGTSWREQNETRLTGNIQERSLGTDTTVHVHGWEELRWILQLGPHLLAAAAHQNPMLNTESPQDVEVAKQRRQEYIRYSVIHKKVKKATTTFPAQHQIEPKEDIYISDEDLHYDDAPAVSHNTDHQRDDDENHPPTTVDKQHIGDHSDLPPSTPCCAICLRPYHIDEDIYWSPNSKCCHHFHSACVEMWLLRNDNCPLCRELYLSPPDRDDENPRRIMVAVPPLRADQIEILERGTTDPVGHATVPNAMQAEDFMEMMVGIERLYQQANNRVVLQTGSGHHFQITISRPDSPTLSDIENELFPPTP